jgi:hypothetical protein
VNRHLANLKRSAPRCWAPLTSLVVPAALMVWLLGLAGCPGSLSFDPGSGGNPDTGGSVETSCANANTVLQMCTVACHNPGGRAIYADLDLMSDGVAARLVGIDAATASGGMCGGKGKLLDRGTLPAVGIFIDKISGTQSCGARMPLGGMLTTADTNCLKAWANGLVSSVGP